MGPSPKKALILQALMRRLKVQESDLEESFMRSSGPGGQNVNKVATCVLIRHRPSGIEVRCQQQRSQWLNRYLARWLLLKRLEHHRLQQQKLQAQRLAKIRRQSCPRPQRVKERMRIEKRRRSDKKHLRRLPRSMED